MFQKIKTI